MTTAFDLKRIDEDDRIMLIGEQAMSMLVGVALESDQPEKIARYIKKITERFPSVKHIDTVPGLTPLVSLVRFGPKIAN